MPFPWKKVKNTKISQLVSDHIESHRRQRGHLVVETGFPTSLIDLFVKNRDRLKKPKPSKKMKKAKSVDISSTLPSSSPFPSHQGPSPSLLKSPSSPEGPSSSSLAPTLVVSSSSLAVNGDSEKTYGVNEERNECPNAKGVLGAILRMSFVVVLALGAKKFAVGLTMSAIFLFLVEYVRKNSYRFLVPYSVTKRRLKLIMQSISQVFIFRDKIFYENSDIGTGFKDQIGASSEFNNHRVESSPICEIQMAEPVFVEEIQGLRVEIGVSGSDSSELRFHKEFDQLSCDGKSPLESSNSKMLVVEEKEGKHGSEHKKGKRARMKLKMKHLVPRKLRRSKKGKRDFEGESCPIRREIVAALEEEPREDEQVDAGSSEFDSEVSSPPSSIRQEGNDQININCDSGLVCEENSDQFVINQEQKKQRKGSCGYLICLIVLIGLVGGRLIAFMLICLWFLMLKSGEKLRRWIKLPGIRSITEKSD